MGNKKQPVEPVIMSPSLFLIIHWYIITGTFVYLGIIPVAIFFGVITLYQTIYNLTWIYEFHEDYVIEEKGILVRTSTRVDYTRIRTVKSETHILMMLVGIGNVSLATSDVYVPELTFRGIDNYKEVEQIFYSHCVESRRSVKRIDIDNFNIN